MSKASMLVVCLGCVYVIWGTTFLAMRVALDSFPPFLLGAIRFLAAGLILMVVSGFKDWPSAREWKRAGVLGLFYVVGSAGAAAWSAQRLPSGAATLVSSLTPCWIVLLDAVVARRMLSVRVSVGVGLGVAACLVLLDLNSIASPETNLVTAVLAAGGLSWAIGSVLARYLQSELPPLAATGLFSIVGGALLGGICLVQGDYRGWNPSDADAAGFAAVLYLVLFGSIVVFSAYEWLVRHASVAVAASHSYFNPIVALALGVVLAGEVLSLSVMLSCLLSLAAVALLTQKVGAPTAVRVPRCLKARVPNVALRPQVSE